MHPLRRGRGRTLRVLACQVGAYAPGARRVVLPIGPPSGSWLRCAPGGSQTRRLWQRRCRLLPRRSRGKTAARLWQPQALWEATPKGRKTWRQAVRRGCSRWEGWHRLDRSRSRLRIARMVRQMKIWFGFEIACGKSRGGGRAPGDVALARMGGRRRDYGPARGLEAEPLSMCHAGGNR